MITALTLAATMSVKPMEERAKDWRNGAIVYQIFVDRFVPPTKSFKYESPRVAKKWSDTPKPGTFSKEAGNWSHELEFWGGTLKGVQSKLDYISELGADIVFLNPIHEAYTNHKYDAIDYKKIDPAFGTEADLKELISGVHQRKMKVVLDGVFNHMGRRSHLFQEALKNPKSPYRDFYTFGSEFEHGYKGWFGVESLVANRVESKGFQKYLWGDSDSVVRHYLNLGTDGWRLDVAYDLGPEALKQITKASHATKKGSLVVGEVNGYPAGWFNSLDGQYNFMAPQVCLEMLTGQVSGGTVGKILNDWIEDSGIESALKSWLIVDNHDTPRLVNQTSRFDEQKLMLALMFTLPGSPNLYYGTELGMEGKGDPENRAPMRWDLVNAKNPTLNWVKQMIAIRKKRQALRYGDFTALRTEKLLSFVRATGKLSENVIVIVNPTDQPVKESFAHRLGNLMSWQRLKDEVSGAEFTQKHGLVYADVPAKSVQILVPVMDATKGYSPYERIK